MPKEPTWIDKVNFIRFFLADGCQTTFMVYIETGGQALHNLVMVLLDFDMFDILRAVFRPGGLRGKRHGRKGRKGGRRKGGIPEVADLLADLNPAKDDLKKRPMRDGGRWLWELDGVGQRILYKIMIVNLVTDFWYDWQSGIVTHKDSNCAGVARLLRTDPNNIIGSNTQFGTISIANFQFENNIPNNTQTFALLPPGNFMCVFAVHATNIFVGTPSVQIRVGSDNEAKGGWSYSSRVTLQPGDAQDLIATAFVKGDQVISWQAISEDANCHSTENKIWIMQMGE